MHIYNVISISIKNSGVCSTYISLYTIEYECVNIDHIDYESINALTERTCRHLKGIVIFEKNLGY